MAESPPSPESAPKPEPRGWMPPALMIDTCASLAEFHAAVVEEERPEMSAKDALLELAHDFRKWAENVKKGYPVPLDAPPVMPPPGMPAAPGSIPPVGKPGAPWV